MNLADTQIEYERQIYSFLDLIGDMGGILDILISVIGIFIFPSTEFSFIIKALQKLYLART